LLDVRHSGCGPALAQFRLLFVQGAPVVPVAGGGTLPASADVLVVPASSGVVEPASVDDGAPEHRPVDVSQVSPTPMQSLSVVQSFQQKLLPW
jgi:hypothetical protein